MKLRTIVTALLLCLCGMASAQTPEISEEQLEIFKSLPPEQQEALMQELLRSRQQGEGADATSRETTRRDTREGRDADRDQVGQRGLGAQGDRRDVRRLSPLGLDQAIEEKPKLEEGSSIIIDLRPRIGGEQGQQRSAVEQNRVDVLRERIARGNPYRLDRFGRLMLPGFEPLPMMGLNEELAAKRLATDPDLSEFVIKVTLLPLEPIGDESLKPFGYELFTDAPSTFAPVGDVPVPADYVVGAGDELRVQLFGTTNRSLVLRVGRDGNVSIPQIGPVAVAGQRYAAVKQSIESRVRNQMIGVQANVEMGETRSIRIFLLGEVAQPGSYTVSGLSTVTNALFVGGGINRIGSLRNVQLKRSGNTVKTLDLYDLLLNGDTSNDARLLPGDVVFIPPVGATTGVNGEVMRPALYEIRPTATVADLIYLSGGLTPRADAREGRLERLNGRGERIVVNVDLTSAEVRSMPVRTGDVLRVLPIRNTLENAVVVDGHVLRPGALEYRAGLRISDVLSFAELKPKADTHYVMIRRELLPDRRLVVLSADLAAALAAKGSNDDVPLAPRDQLTVFDLESGRDRAVSALIRELRSQATHAEPLQMVSVGGRVRAPGQYPLEPDMSVSDLIRAGGSLEDAAYGGQAELTRYQVVNGEQRQTELIDIDLAAVLKGDPVADIALGPYDTLTIKEVPHWREEESVTILGEVRFPGVYPIQRGETLRSVLGRAGGLTDLAFPQGGVFTREELRRREQQQLDLLSSRLRRDLAVLALQGGVTGTQVPQTASIGQGLLAELQSSHAVGRLVIDLEGVLKDAPGGKQDIVLRQGDQLLVPKQSQEVTVIGEVQNATSHRYAEGFSRDDYIGLSGGYTNKADKGRVYVVRANGSVEAREGGGWFSRSTSEIRPGDTVVVPLDAERMRPLPLWTAVTQILYNLAIAAAAVNSF